MKTTPWIGVFFQAPDQRGMDIHPNEPLTEAESAAIRDATGRFGVIEQRAAYKVLKHNHRRLIDMLTLFENTERVRRFTWWTQPTEHRRKLHERAAELGYLHALLP